MTKAELISVLKQMTPTATDKAALEAIELYPKWKTNQSVFAGMRYQFEGKLYRCEQSHTTQEGWEPGEATKALWTEVSLEEYPKWVQPTGAQDVYNMGDIVDYNGTLYKSLIDGNVYSPDAYPAGWEEYKE